MEEIIKEIRWLCQTKGFSGADAADLMKVEALHQIRNRLDAIETDLSEFLDIVRVLVDEKNAESDAELSRLMEAWGIIKGSK